MCCCNSRAESALRATASNTCSHNNQHGSSKTATVAGKELSITHSWVEQAVQPRLQRDHCQCGTQPARTVRRSKEEARVEVLRQGLR